MNNDVGCYRQVYSLSRWIDSAENDLRAARLQAAARVRQLDDRGGANGPLQLLSRSRSAALVQSEDLSKVSKQSIHLHFHSMRAKASELN